MITYTRQKFGMELKNKVHSKKSKESIGAWCYLVYSDHNSDDDYVFNDIVYDLMFMELGPEFQYSDEELEKIADDLILDKTNLIVEAIKAANILIKFDDIKDIIPNIKFLNRHWEELRFERFNSDHSFFLHFLGELKDDNLYGEKFLTELRAKEEWFVKNYKEETQQIGKRILSKLDVLLYDDILPIDEMRKRYFHDYEKVNLHWKISLRWHLEHGDSSKAIELINDISSCSDPSLNDLVSDILK